MGTPYDTLDNVSPSFGMYDLPAGLPGETENYVSSIMPNVDLPDNATIQQTFDTALPALIHQESRGSDSAVSPVGAKYKMQVMPDTAKNPGFGIQPAQSDTPEEYNRVGREYFLALLKKYNGNLPLALAAYNAGPRRVDSLLDTGEFTKYFNQHPVINPSDIGDSLDSVSGVAPKGGRSGDQSARLKAQEEWAKSQQPSMTMEFAQSLGQSYLQEGRDIYRDVVGLGAKFGNFKDNYWAQHETKKVSLTPQEQKAAKLLGYKDTGDLTVYKISPEERKAVQDAAMEKAGLSKEDIEKMNTGAENAASGDLADGDVFAAWLQNSLVSQGVSLATNPHMPASLRYQKIKTVSRAMDIVKDQNKYPKQVVNLARQVLAEAKAQGSSTITGDLKGIVKEAVTHPYQLGKQLVGGALTSPILTAGTAGMGSAAKGVGKKVFGFSLERALGLAGRSATEAKLASALAKLKFASRLPSIDPALGASIQGTAERAAAREAALSGRSIKALSAAQKIAKKQKLLESALIPTMGAGINVGAAALSDEATEGHTTPGSLVSAGIIGAGGSELFSLAGKGVSKLHGRIGNTKLPSVDTSVRLREAPGEPGEPLPPESPINDTGHVPYTGGVSSTGTVGDGTKFIHIDKNFPDNLSLPKIGSGKVTVPVKRVVANVHEAVEYPLMHLTGPMSNEAILRLASRIKGEGKLTPEIIRQLKGGKSLDYQTAHKIATWAENGYVRRTFNVDPEVYQNSLKPFIKDITEASKTEPRGNIPDDLDTKPYENTGEGGQLKGRGSRPLVDVVKGEKKSTKAGTVAKKGTTAAALGGAGLGAYLYATNPKDRNPQDIGASGAIFVLPFVLRRAEIREDFDRIKFDTPEYKKVSDAVNEAKKIVREAGTDEKLKEKASEFLKDHTSQQEIEKSARELYVRRIEEAERAGNPMEEPLTFGQRAMAAERHAKELIEKGLHPRAIWEHTNSKYKVPMYVDRDKNITTPISTANDLPIIPEKHDMVMNDRGEFEAPMKESLGGTTYQRLFPEIVDKQKLHLYSPTQQGELGYSDLKGIHLTHGSSFNTLNDTISHEFQHSVQDRYHLPTGSNPRLESTRNVRRLNDISDQLKYIRERIHKYSMDSPVYKALVAKQEKLKSEFSGRLTQDPFQDYYRQQGEIMARQSSSHNYRSQEDINKIFPEDHPEFTKAVSGTDGPLISYGKVGPSRSASIIPENDQELVERAKQNDRQAIDAIFKTHFPKISHYIDSQFRNYAQKGIVNGEDVASEAIWQGLQHLDGYDGRSSLSTWLHQIAKNVALNEIKANRALKRSAPLGEVSIRPAEDSSYEGMGEPGTVREVEDKSAQTPEQAASDLQDLASINKLINRLPETLKDAYSLKLFEDMSDAEIGKQLGISTNAAKRRIFLARNKFSRWSQAEFGKTLSDSNRGLPGKESGKIDQELAKKLAKGLTLGLAGATLGTIYDKDNPLQGAWSGGIVLGVLGAGVKWHKVWPSITDMFGKPERTNTSMLLDNHEAAVKRNNIMMDQIYQHMVDLVPDKTSRERITRWLDDPTSVPLTDQEYQAALEARKFYDQTGQEAFQQGVLGELINNYVNHEWGNSKKARLMQERISEEIGKVSNMSPKDRHALARNFLTIAQGEQAGLIPRTLDVAELMRIYGRSMGRAMANKTLIDSLKAERMFPDKDYTAIMPGNKAPLNYIYINHPALAHFKVSPIIAPSVRFLFDVQNPSALVAAAMQLNTAWKRMKVSFSLFHPVNLMIAHLAANPFSELLRHPQDVPLSWLGQSRGHKAYKNWYKGSKIDNLITNGLEVESQRGGVTSEDVKGDAFYDSLRTIQNFMNGVIPKSGTLTAGTMRRINEFSDQVIWNNVHKGLKLVTALNAYERMTRTWAQVLEKNPGADVPSPEGLARQAASFANDAFGGLNWRRLADDATTNFGRELALRMASPAARRVNQLLLFAPDWTFSTIRMFTKAARGGSGVKGLFKPRTETDLRRQYIMRSAIIYGTLYNALNMAMVGHPIWDNKDPLSVDLGNGETTPANKHFLEFPHLVWDTLHGRPFQFWLNKLGTVPKEVAEQALGVEYLSDKEMRPMKEGRIAHILNALSPIGVENLQDKGWQEALASMAGFPIYGKHAPRTEAEKEAMEEKRHEAAVKAARTRRKNRLKKLYQ